ncbi:MAG TPA: hypothetical protein VL981_12155 [Candidatus Methylacidiphilales bacterium]|nr:hypothetical protein [Candidatus Methylacidiphilales bacterium]
MKRNLLKLLVIFAALSVGFSSKAIGQDCQTDPFSITNNGDDNLRFNDFPTLTGLEGVMITMTVTSVDATGQFQGASSTPIIPQATFVDFISLSDVNYPPAQLTETDNYTGSAPLAQNATVSFNADNFTPLPNSSASTITMNLPNADLANMVGNGQFNLDINSQLPNPNPSGVNIPNYTYMVMGNVMVCPEFVPEPSRLDSFIALAMMAFVVYRSRRS